MLAGALSYFVGYRTAEDNTGMEEDKGFAMAFGDRDASSLSTIRSVAMSRFAAHNIP